MLDIKFSEKTYGGKNNKDSSNVTTSQKTRGWRFFQRKLEERNENYSLNTSGTFWRSFIFNMPKFLMHVSIKYE